MESLTKNINQDNLQKASLELLELEIKKSNPNITIKELNEIEEKEKEIYKQYPMLED